MSTRLARTESGEMPVTKGSLREPPRLQGTFNPEAASLVDQLKGNKVEETKENDSSEDEKDVLEMSGIEVVNWAHGNRAPLSPQEAFSYFWIESVRRL